MFIQLLPGVAAMLLDKYAIMQLNVEGLMRGGQKGLECSWSCHFSPATPLYLRRVRGG